MDWLADPQAWIAFLTLVALEIVLGIDNIIFITILAGKLPPEQQARARYIGLSLALVLRVILLFSLSWVIGLTAPIFTVLEQEISGRDLILLFGGLFLLGKATFEIHENLEGEEGHASARVKAQFTSERTRSETARACSGVWTHVGVLPPRAGATWPATGAKPASPGP